MPTVWENGLFHACVCWVTYAARVTPRHPDSPPPTPAIVAAVVCLVEALLLVATAVLYGLELADGRAEDADVASMSLVVCLIFAILLAVLAAAWRKGATWPRTATLVWNVLLLPAAWTLSTTTGIWAGLGLAALALTGVVASLLAPAAELPDRTL